MNERFSVNVAGPHLPVADGAPVVFHGTSKSGSLTMSNVIREAYLDEGRIDQYVSTYHTAPRDFDEFAAIMRSTREHRFFVSHYIYGRIEPPPGALLVTQVRHPLPRTLSVYGWLRYKHEKKSGTPGGFPTLAEWVRHTRGKQHSQMATLALGFGDGRREEMISMDTAEIRERALENLHRDFAWFGVAEIFEESIFTMAHICGLGSVTNWEKDTRNSKRPSLAETSRSTIDLIGEVFADELAFYEGALDTFRRRVGSVDFGPSIEGYREACRNEYKERLVVM